MKDIFIRYKLVTSVFAIISILIIVSISIFWGDKPELVAYDFRAFLRTTPADPDIVIVAIDNYALDKANNFNNESLGRFPWPRTAYSKVLNFISQSNPSLIILDINLEGKNLCATKQFSDDKFIQDIKNIPSVFYVHSLTQSQKLLKTTIPDFNNYKSLNVKQKSSFYKQIAGDGPDALLKKHTYNILDKTLGMQQMQDTLFYVKMPLYLEGIYQYATGIGINNSFEDIDGIIRSYQPLYNYRDNYLFSIPLAAFYFLKGNNEKVILDKDYLIIGKKTIPLNQDLRFYINWKSPPPLSKSDNNDIFFHIPQNMHYKTISFHKVYFPHLYNINKGIFKDKIVIIGTTASILKDYFKGPDSKILLGVDIIATAIDNLLNDSEFIKRLPLWINIITTLILLAIGALISFVHLKSRNPVSKTTLYALIIYLLTALIAYLFVNTLLFVKFSLWLNMFYPSLIYILTFSSLIAITTIIERDRRSQVESVFSKYVSPQIYQTVLADFKPVDLSAKRYDITILFSDIRGFTPLTEALYPEEVAEYLNTFFNAMVKVILNNNGTIDKFMGDAIMAFFGAPVPSENHSFNAVKAALDMKKAMDELNDHWIKLNKRTLNIGIGLNSGSALVGNFGADKLMDFTVIGDTVNLASRVESLNKEENTNILITAYTYEKVKDLVNVRIIGPRKVKGKSEDIVIYELLGLK